MLEQFFESPTRLRQMRRGPLAMHIDAMAAELREGGYANTTARAILTLVAKFSLYARGEGVRNAGEIDDSLAKCFLEIELPKEGIFHTAPNAIRHVMEHLRRHRIVAATPASESPDIDPYAKHLTGYDRYLADVRGLVSATRENYLRGARMLLQWWTDENGDKPLSQLSGPDILKFVTAYGNQYPSRSWRRHLHSNTRGFLRYLRWEAIIDTDLDRVVPRAYRWRLDTLPRHLPWEHVRALIDSIETHHPEGLRDKAILLLVAGLGLRANEIRTLEFRQLGWKTAELRLPRTKSRRERVLPLPKEIGAALADYALHGRPPLEIPQVFVRHRAPQGALQSSGAIGAVIFRHLRRMGIDTPTRGTNLLRHSLATRMVNVGVPIKHIADILGHRSIDTTAIYTKVDRTSLAVVSLPFSAGGAK